MNSIGIIAEYNPFHIGHFHQIETLKKSYPQMPIIIIMSGAFVQRGEPALFSKFDRAKWALLCGADLVVELPSHFALANAEQFALGAMTLLYKLKISHCSFGTEHASLSDLQKLADLSESIDVHLRCQKLLQEGLNYGAAFRQAQEEALGNAPNSQWLSKPNVILGLEYIRSAKKLSYPVTFLPLKRNSDHHKGSLCAPSGTLLRNYIREGQIDENLFNAFPRPIRGAVRKAIEGGHYVDYERYEDLILGASRLTIPQQLSQYYDFEEGLENLWVKGSQRNTFKGLLETVKSKRYSYSRLQRMSAYMLLQRRKKDMEAIFQAGPQYARLLAFSKTGQKWLRDYEGSFPIVHRWGQFVKGLYGLSALLAQGDMMAQDIQSYAMRNGAFRQGGSDFYEDIFIEKSTL